MEKGNDMGTKNKLITGIRYQSYTENREPVIYEKDYCLVQDLKTGKFKKYAIIQDIIDNTLILSPDYDKPLK